MLHVSVAFHGEVRDHAQGASPDGVLNLTLELPAGLRDVVQSVGVPHVECGELEVNGEARSWDWRVVDGDEISVRSRYPLPAPPLNPRFLLDDHLGKLARHLRLLGYDVDHETGVDDAVLAQRSVSEDRTLLTRDCGLLMRAMLQSGRFIRTVEPLQQAIEVVRSFALSTLAKPFTRCIECNEPLVAASPSEVVDRVPASAAARQDHFRRCPSCRRVYWEGTHVDDLRDRVRLILEGART